ncbi:MAG: T9SS type A sorting domain-containing protein [Bacteroidota bacterium]
MKITALTLLLLIVFSFPIRAQGSLKGNGQVFFTETFDWENPDDPKGWTAPPGYYMMDPTDNGYNWHWYPNDSLIAQWVKEPPMHSTTAENGSLTLFADKYNEYKDPTIPLDNSIGFPPIDCSSHGSVIVRYETVFMNYSTGWKMLFEVSVDNWTHSAQFDVGFGCGHKGRPNNTQPGIPAICEVNISEVAAGQPNVQFRFTWRGTDDYFWQIDDFTVAEAWDNDLQMKLSEMEWNDGDVETTLTPFFMIPKTQIGDGGYTNFKAAALNFGEYDQTDVFLAVDVTKNNQNIFHKVGTVKDLPAFLYDTTLITDQYSPVDYGHYKVTFDYKQSETENTPANDMKEVFFDVTDSAYSHADNSSEEAFCWGFEAYGSAPNMNHIMGVVYPIFSDCEVNSISAYIAGGKADGMIDFKFKLFNVPTEGDDLTPVELMMTEALTLDSAMIGTWITLPLSKDGESEFLKAGEKVYAVVEYNNLHEDLASRRYDNLKIGSDVSFKIKDAVSVARGDGDWVTDGFAATPNLMIRLNLNEHGNPIDGIDPVVAFSALGQNYPNPFAATTNITYNLANGSEVTVEIRDITGRILMQRSEGYVTAGSHRIQIDGNTLDPGIYMYTLRAGNYTETRRMTLSR